MFSYSWTIFRPGPNLGRSEAKVSRPGASKSCGASTVELAIFFTLVAAILGSVILFLTGTLPQMYAAARLTNALEGATLVKPRLGAIRLHSLPADPRIWAEIPPIPNLELADNRPLMFQALTKEADAIRNILGMAFPAGHRSDLLCLAVYSFKAGECAFNRARAEMQPGPACPLGSQNQCIVAQAEAILRAKGCRINNHEPEPEATLLVGLYPSEGTFLKSPCAVTEIGLARVIEH